MHSGLIKEPHSERAKPYRHMPDLLPLLRCRENEDTLEAETLDFSSEPVKRAIAEHDAHWKTIEYKALEQAVSSARRG